MSSSYTGRGRGRSNRSVSGRGAQQPPQTEPMDLNVGTSFSGMFSAGFLDPPQSYGTYIPNLNEQQFGDVHGFGFGTDPAQTMQFTHSARGQIPTQPQVPVPQVPVPGGAGGIPWYNQQYGSGNMQYNSNQWLPPPRFPVQSAQNEQIPTEEAGRGRQSPTAAQSETGSVQDKIFLQPDGDTFVPYQGVVHRIVEILAGKYPRPWTKWSEVPLSQRDIWFNEFKKYYYWHPDNEAHIRRNFEFRGATRLRDILGYARKTGKMPKWLAPTIWTDMQKHWSDDENFKKLSQQNKKNRLSDVEGLGPSLHTGGSIPTSERKRRLARELGREPTFDELFKATHCKAKDKSFVDKKSASKYEEHQKKWQELSQAASQGGSQQPLPTPEELWIERNLDKKGRVYGFGTEGVKLKKSASIAASRHSSAEHFDAREHIARLNETIAKQGEMLASQQKLLNTVKKKTSKGQRMMQKVFKFFKSQSAGSSSQANVDPGEAEDEDEDDEDEDEDEDNADHMNLSD